MYHQQQQHSHNHSRASFKEVQQENVVSADKFQRFEAWLRENGSHIDLVSVKGTGVGRGGYKTHFSVLSGKPPFFGLRKHNGLW